MQKFRFRYYKLKLPKKTKLQASSKHTNIISRADNNYQLEVNLGNQFHLASTVLEKDDTVLLSSDISGNIDLSGKSWTFSSF